MWQAQHILKRNISVIIIFLIAMAMFDSCSETNQSMLVSEITGSIDSLQQVYAPDKRVTVWDVSVQKKGNKIVVNAEVEGRKALAALLQLKEKYPSLNIKVKLLPDLPVNERYALVNNSVCNIRKKTTRKSEMLNQALLGTPLKVFKKKGDWYYVQTPNQYLGWVNKAAIVLFDSVSLRKYETGEKVVFNRQCGFSYSKPDSRSQDVSDLVIGCILPVKGEVKGFYQVEYPDGRMAFVKKRQVMALHTLMQKKPTQEGVVKTALKFNGIPYLWGGFSSKGIDCSGLTSTVYFLNGIILQRDADEQAKYGKVITTRFDDTKLQPGDLLFFGPNAKGALQGKVTHVAMYIGHGYFIQSAGRVKISCMDKSKADYAAEYGARFIRANRIIGQKNGNTIQKINSNSLYKLLETK